MNSHKKLPLYLCAVFAFLTISLYTNQALADGFTYNGTCLPAPSCNNKDGKCTVQGKPITCSQAKSYLQSILNYASTHSAGGKQNDIETTRNLLDQCLAKRNDKETKQKEYDAAVVEQQRQEGKVQKLKKDHEKAKTGAGICSCDEREEQLAKFKEWCKKTPKKADAEKE